MKRSILVTIVISGLLLTFGTAADAYAGGRNPNSPTISPNSYKVQRPESASSRYSENKRDENDLELIKHREELVKREADYDAAGARITEIDTETTRLGNLDGDIATLKSDIEKSKNIKEHFEKTTTTTLNSINAKTTNNPPEELTRAEKAIDNTNKRYLKHYNDLTAKLELIEEEAKTKTDKLAALTKEKETLTQTKKDLKTDGKTPTDKLAQFDIDFPKIKDSFPQKDEIKTKLNAKSKTYREGNQKHTIISENPNIRDLAREIIAKQKEIEAKEKAGTDTKIDYKEHDKELAQFRSLYDSIHKKYSDFKEGIKTKKKFYEDRQKLASKQGGTLSKTRRKIDKKMIDQLEKDQATARAVYVNELAAFSGAFNDLIVQNALTGIDPEKYKKIHKIPDSKKSNYNVYIEELKYLKAKYAQVSEDKAKLKKESRFFDSSFYYDPGEKIKYQEMINKKWLDYARKQKTALEKLIVEKESAYYDKIHNGTFSPSENDAIAALDKLDAPQEQDDTLTNDGALVVRPKTKASAECDPQSVAQESSLESLSYKFNELAQMIENLKIQIQLQNTQPKGKKK